jgi:hypothetical protein
MTRITIYMQGCESPACLGFRKARKPGWDSGTFLSVKLSGRKNKTTILLNETLPLRISAFSKFLFPTRKKGCFSETFDRKRGKRNKQVRKILQRKQ